MADVRINTGTATTTIAADDYIVLDGTTNGTRAILGTNVAAAVGLGAAGTPTHDTLTLTTGLTSPLVASASGANLAVNVGTAATGILSVNAATEATSSTAAGTILAGGLAVAKKLNVGTEIKGATLSLSGNAALTGATATVTIGSTNTSSMEIDANGALTITPKTTATVKGGGGVTAAQLTLGAHTTGSAVLTLKSYDATDDFFRIDVSNQSVQGSNEYGTRVTLNVENGNTAHAYGSGALLGQVFVKSDNSQSYSGRQTGLYGYIRHGGTGTLGDARGIYTTGGPSSSGNITNLFGVFSDLFETAGQTGGITTAYHYFVNSFAHVGGGAAPTNVYGLYVDDQTAGVTNYAIKTIGAALISLGGVVTAGATGAHTFGTTDTVTMTAGALTATKLITGLSLKTAAPTTGTSGTWKLGTSVTSGTSTLDVSGYVELDIGGALVKLARVTNI